MKERKQKPILAAGGIVLRGDRKPEIAIVRLRKLDAWVLPKGKLAGNENAIAAARREVLEETGHRVAIHEFLGTLAYEVGGRPKLVQFWRMQAIGGPVRGLMRDVKAVQWLPLEDAIAQLTHVRERVFLEHVGPIALRAAERAARRDGVSDRSVRKGPTERTRSEPGTVAARPASFAQGALLETAEAPLQFESTSAPGRGFAGPIAPVGNPTIDLDPFPPRAKVMATAGRPNRGTRAAAGRTLLEKTWVWFRQAASPNRSPGD